MFKIIFNHLSSQTITKPSIAAKFNRWSLSKADLNINRFENVLFFYKKELLNSKYNTKKVISYNMVSIIEGFFFITIFSSIIMLLLASIYICIKLLKTNSLVYSIKSSIYFLISNQFTYFILFTLLISLLIYFFFKKNQNFSLSKYNLDK